MSNIMDFDVDVDELRAAFQCSDPDAPLLDRLRKPPHTYSPGELRHEAADEIEGLRAALNAMLDHVQGEQFCYCEYKDYTQPADEGDAVDVARAVLHLKENTDATD